MEGRRNDGSPKSMNFMPWKKMLICYTVNAEPVIVVQGEEARRAA